MDGKELKIKQKQIKAKHLKGTCISLADDKKRNNGRIPHEMVHAIVQI